MSRMSRMSRSNEPHPRASGFLALGSIDWASPGARGWQLPVLVALVLLSSLGAIFASHEARRHFEALERARLARDQLLEQRGRLLIERGAFSAYHRVDVIATEQLVMRSPGVEDTVLVRP